MQRYADTGVVTPEAVRLEFEEATVGSRAVAIIVDWLIQFAALMVGALAGGMVMGQVGGGLPPWVGVTLLALLTFLVLFGYPIAFETLNRGRTPGKVAMGLRVVTVEGAPVGFRHAAIRAALGLVDFALTSGFVAVITALVSARGQRLGDHIAGTVVVRERTGAGPAVAASFTVPRGYERYAASLDPAGMRSEDYQAARAFILRAPDLPAERRAALGQRIAAGLAARIAHRIPDGVHPEAFLLCVAARYQGRGTRGPSPLEAPAGGAPPPRAAALSPPPPPPPQPQQEAPHAPVDDEPSAQAPPGPSRGGFTAPG